MEDKHINLKCATVLHYFEEISKIPRASGNEKQISDFLVDFAQKNNFWVKQDEANNVVIKVPASKGYENSPIIIIQGHMDMVCEMEKGCEHNFAKDGIKLIYDGDFLTADRTTLGGDDGIAVAMAMALAVDKDIFHPALELVITTDEEVGMCGANALDTSILEGKILLNIDSEDEGIFTAGCAGGVKTTSIIPLKKVGNIYDKSYKIEISGLKGGHSGIDIDKNRANANKIMGVILNNIRKDISLSSINGGAKDNAIPRYAEAVISFNSINYEEIAKKAEEIFNSIICEYKETDSSIKIELLETRKVEKVFDEKSKNNIIDFIFEVFNGINTMSKELPDLPESSNNVGVVKTNDGDVEFICAVRSSAIDKKEEIKNKIISLSEKCGGKTIEKGEYPAWEYKESSFIRELCINVYEDIYGKKPKIDIIHAGLECGLFSSKIKDADMISFGPDIIDIHTPDERLSISSTERVWGFLIELLKRIK